jgi:hypothetical protein
MQIQELKNGQMVKARCGRAGSTNVKWGSWRTATLYVQSTVPSRKFPVPKVVLLSLQDGGNGAEYRPEDFCPADNCFMVEDYYLEIEGLKA